MAVQKPLVIISGQIQQIPAGDTLSAAASEVDVFAKLSATQTLVIGCPVYSSAATTVEKAAANAAATAKVIGLMQSVSTGVGVSGFVQEEGLLTATTGQWDAVAGTTGGLTAGTEYYLSATPGLITSTPPSASGNYVKRLGIGLSSTELLIQIAPQDVLLA